jgi:hypothetical protein
MPMAYASGTTAISLFPDTLARDTITRHSREPQAPLVSGNVVLLAQH